MISKFKIKIINFVNYFKQLWKQNGLEVAVGIVLRDLRRKYIYNGEKKDNQNNEIRYENLKDYYNVHMSMTTPIIPTLPRLDRGATVNLLIPTVTKENSFAGVATALILSILVAKEFGYKLRIICTDQFTESSSVKSVITNYRINFNLRNIKILNLTHIPRDLDIRPDDIFIATSWWTAKILQQMPIERYVYLIQDYESLFYVEGDYTNLVDSTYKDKKSIKIFNTKILMDYFEKNSLLNKEKNVYTYFTPAFPKFILKSGPNLRSNNKQKKNLFFYARPSTPRNGFLTGIGSIYEIFNQGILDINKWNIYFAGEDNLPNFVINGKKVINLGKLPFDRYVKFLQTVNLGISLMTSPHPSYPPLEIAASGGVVVTNKFANKVDLGNRYSKNILMADFNLESVINTVRKYSNMSIKEIRDNYKKNNFVQSWTESFNPVINLIKKQYGNIK